MGTPGQSIPSLVPLPFSLGNSSDVSDTEIFLSKRAVSDQRCNRANFSQNANNQSMLTVVNLLKKLKIMSICCGVSFVGITLGPNHCEKVVYQPREPKIDRSKGCKLKQIRNSVHSMWGCVIWVEQRMDYII